MTIILSALRIEFIWLALGVAAVAFGTASCRRSDASLADVASQPTPVAGASLVDLLNTPTEKLNEVGLARMNLVCAEGLRVSGDLNIQASLEVVEQMVRRVNSETERHFHKFKTNPRDFNGSEAYFRMLCLVTVLQQDFHISYNPARAKSRDGPMESNEVFFADSRDIFLHGPLSEKRTGTCASLPVLYVAVGRRLGYPLKLTTTKNHLFVRWEDAKERLNVEATCQGLNCYEDEYYRRWPFPMTAEEERANQYLKSLTPPEELAVFLSLRAQCLRATGRFKEAVECLEHACRLAPDNAEHRKLLVQAGFETSRSIYGESPPAMANRSQGTNPTIEP